MRALSVLSLVVLTSCARSGLPGLEGLRPSLRLTELEVERVTLEAIETNLVFAVDNPYPFDLDLTGLEWTLNLAGAVEIGGSREGPVLAAGRESAFQVPFALRWTEVLPAVRDLAAGQRLPWTLTGAGTFDTPVGGVRVPFEAAGELDPVRRPGA